MKKTFLFLLAAVLLVSLVGCSVEIQNPKEPSPENIHESEEPSPETSFPSEPSKEDPETESISEPSAEGNDEPEPAESGIEKEKTDFAHAVLSGTASFDVPHVSSGSNGTSGLELVEEFILSVEKNEAASVCGTMNGNTFPFYFELSFEPGGLIKLIQIPPHSVLSGRSGELSEIYDTEAFYCFLDGEGNYFSIPKIKFYTDERFPCEPGEDISGAAVTAKEAETEAKNAILLSEVSSPDFSYENNKSGFFGTYGSINNSGDPEKAGEYFKNLIPKVTGHAVLEGEYYYMVSMFEGETNVGYGYAISAARPFKIFSISEVDGSFCPIAYNIEPRVILPAE